MVTLQSYGTQSVPGTIQCRFRTSVKCAANVQRASQFKSSDPLQPHRGSTLDASDKDGSHISKESAVSSYSFGFPTRVDFPLIVIRRTTTEAQLPVTDESLRPSSQRVVEEFIESSYSLRFRSPRRSSQRWSLRKYFANLISGLTVLRKQDRCKRGLVPPSSPFPTPSVKRKLEETARRSELSPESSPMELYSPPPDTRDRTDEFVADMRPHRPSNKEFASTVSSYIDPITPIAELPSDDRRMETSIAAIAELAQSDSIQRSSKTTLSFDSSHVRYARDFAQWLPPQILPVEAELPDPFHWVPELSPQTLSPGSLPVSPETPGMNRLTWWSSVHHEQCSHAILPKECHMVPGYDNGAANASIEQALNDSGPSDYGELNFRNFELDVNVDPVFDFYKSTAEHVTDNQKRFQNHPDRLQTEHMALRADSNNGIGNLPGTIAGCDVSVNFHKAQVSGWEPTCEASLSILQPAYLSSFCLLDTQRPPPPQFRSEVATGRVDADKSWTSHDESALTLNADEVERIAVDQATASMVNEQSLHWAAVEEAPFTPARSTRSLQCPSCHQRFTGQYAKGNKRRHVRAKHGSGSGYKCRRCGKPYKRSDARLNHERVEHPEMQHASPEKRVAPR